MGQAWSDDIARYLVNTKSCPRCDAKLVIAGRCSNCNADLTSPVAAEIMDASRTAADAIRLRQGVIDRLPTLAVAVAPPPARAATPTRESTSNSQISVQSVLAVVGAALFAIAAIVFTFLNPDLTNFATRTTIVGAVTIVFLGGAWLLASAKLQFSAEAVGALGMVFVVLDIWALSSKAPDGVSGWAFAAIGTLVAAVIILAVAWLARVRTWLWIALVWLALVPAMFGYAFGNQWATAIGYLGVGFVALGVNDVARVLRTRFDSQLHPERWAATILQLIAVVLVGGTMLTLGTGTTPELLGEAGLFAVVAVEAALASRNPLPRLWSFIAGGAVVAAAACVAVGGVLSDQIWLAAAAPTAGAVAVVALAVFARTGLRRESIPLARTQLLIGAWVALLIVTVPAGLLALVQLVTVLHPAFATGHVLEPGLAAAIGLAATTVGTWALSLLARRITSTRGGVRWDIGLFVTALWGGGYTVVAIADWSGFTHVAQVAIALGSAIVAGVVTWRVSRVAQSAARDRLPVAFFAHGLVVLAAVIAWTDPILSVVGGAAVVLGVAAVARTVPAKARPAHVAVGYAYALIVLAHALSLAHLEQLAVLCVTTSVASLFALGVTLVKRLGVGFWYAVLGVTLVPFVIAVVDVLVVRSGWTALSTAVTFGLALTLLLVRRPGLGAWLRTIAAALLVPSLAVVVICLAAQLLPTSGSPVALPIIAVIVAAAFAGSTLSAAALRRHGLPEVDVRYARIAIEVSSLVTGGLAVVLALVRAAAGLDTSFLVFLIIGVGAGVAGLATHRVFAWAVAGIAWTGALWCLWGIVHVFGLEPYILPPALGVAIVGAVSVGRKLPGIGLFSVGLACATVPSLVALAVVGNGGADYTPWRAYGLLAASAVLLLVGGVLSRGSDRPVLQRLSALAAPTVGVGIIAAAAGAVQAVRYGWAIDPSPFDLVMVPALVLCIAAAGLAVGGAALLTTLSDAHPRLARSRWLFVPAALYLVVGPIAAIRPDWFSIWTLWGITIALLAGMLAATVAGRNRSLPLPPVWLLFVLAWCTAVAGWSQRELRVEAFSLPLGFALLAVGVIALRPASYEVSGSRYTSWPIGSSGSWRLLAPGIAVTFLPSILATGTDPQTLRAILVISLALVAILIGSLRKLAAPFILGIVVLPIENITVFAVQLGRSISATPWWITLATAGAVLLVIAVTYERRDAGSRGVAARMRDLR